jgi:DNA-binding CsgD family transcriptional regulator
LARLRSAGSIDDLVESIPIHTVALGYERAMFSWVDDEHWVPRSMHTISGPEEARTILAAGSPPYTHVRDLLEVDVVRNRRAILVLDCETNPRVHPKITPVSRSHTYVAAPIVARNHVAAFVHLDRSVASGANDEFDRDLLALFCEGIGVMLDRLLASDRPVADGIPQQHVADWVDALTPREHEVLRLMADGLTNPEISNRLFISQDTTKTHVKKLMRKLGTHTRAEAGAMYHRLRVDRRGPALP